LRSAKKSDKTVQSYLEAARLLAGWLGGRITLEQVRPADIEDFMIFLLGAHAASTAAVRFKSLRLADRRGVDRDQSDDPAATAEAD
jgi:hypothetical protein